MRRVLLGLVVAACGARTGLGAVADDGTATVPPPGGGDASSGPRPPPPPADAGADVGPDVLTPPSPICVAPDGGLGATTCRRTLRVLAITKSSLSCFVDTIVKDGDRGTLVFDCDGGGAEIQFGAHTMTGSFDGRRVDTCTGTAFDFSDGCRWNSAQRIQGDLTQQLRFDYAESPAPGERGCLSPCSASAVVVVE